MLQNPCKTLGFKKNMVYKIPPGGGGGKPYPASGLIAVDLGLKQKQTTKQKRLSESHNILIRVPGKQVKGYCLF